jgi:hypothetical protein
MTTNPTPLVDTIEITIDQLNDTWSLMREPGRDGFEAAVLWIGRVDAHGRAVVGRVVRPRQWATRTAGGVGVALDPDGLTDLILSLEDEIVVARLHTHPTTAYHSHVDDHNTVIGHAGAISIVVPNFAAGPPDLHECSVNVLAAEGWREIPQPELAERIDVR